MSALSNFGWLARGILVVGLATAQLPAQMASHAPTTVATEPYGAFAITLAPMVTGKPVARVNGVVMTDADLLREMYTIFPYARQHNGFPKEMEADIRKGALQMIIFEELAFQQAQRQGTAVPPERVNHALLSLKKKFSTADEYREYLKADASGSEKVLKDRIRRSLLINAFLKDEVTDKSTVSLAAARAFYDKRRERFRYKESFAFQSISIMPPETANADAMKEARRRAEDALRQAKATKNYQEFGLLAEKISQDDFRVNMGDHRAVEREQLPDTVITAALAMKPGEVSDIIPLGKTFTIFRLNGHIPAGIKKFDEVKDQLRKEMQKDKEDRLRIALDTRLRNNAKVEEL
jgi:peptidyl-prolyl cis-trans isomerase C